MDLRSPGDFQEEMKLYFDLEHQQNSERWKREGSQGPGADENKGLLKAQKLNKKKKVMPTFTTQWKPGLGEVKNHFPNSWLLVTLGLKIGSWSCCSHQRFPSLCPVPHSDLISPSRCLVLRTILLMSMCQVRGADKLSIQKTNNTSRVASRTK